MGQRDTPVATHLPPGVQEAGLPERRRQKIPMIDLASVLLTVLFICSQTFLLLTISFCCALRPTWCDVLTPAILPFVSSLLTKRIPLRCSPWSVFSFLP